MGHLSDTGAPLYKDHLSTEATIGWTTGHLSDSAIPLYEDYLSTEATITLSLEWSLYHRVWQYSCSVDTEKKMAAVGNLCNMQLPKF